MRVQSCARRALSVLTIFLAVLPQACGSALPPRAQGPRSEAVLLHDPGVLEPRGRAWAEALAAPVEYQGRPEARFVVRRRAGAPRRSDLTERNVILVTLIDSGSALDTRVQRSFPAADVERLRRAAGFMLYTDVWAREQVVALVAASRVGALDSLLEELGASWAPAFDRAVVTRWARALRDASARDVGTVEGVAIPVPPEYRAAPLPDGWPGARRWLRDTPTRVVTLLWLDDVDSTQSRSPAFLVGMQRDALWRLDGDTLVEDATRVEPRGGDTFLAGTWQNERDVAGGPVLTRFAYDAARRRLFAVQGVLFAPGRAKHAFVRELHALLAAFTLEKAT